jgi:hypothetical protein
MRASHQATCASHHWLAWCHWHPLNSCLRGNARISAVLRLVCPLPCPACSPYFDRCVTRSCCWGTSRAWLNKQRRGRQHCRHGLTGEHSDTVSLPPLQFCSRAWCAVNCQPGYMAGVWVRPAKLHPHISTGFLAHPLCGVTYNIRIFLSRRCLVASMSCNMCCRLSKAAATLSERGSLLASMHWSLPRPTSKAEQQMSRHLEVRVCVCVWGGGYTALLAVICVRV